MTPSPLSQPLAHDVPQGSVLGPLLFLIYINDFHKVIKHSKVHHFADDTNLLYSNKSLKKINKHINHDLKLTVQWLRANRISLNVAKTEIIIFQPKNKKIEKVMNFRLSGQKITPTTHTRYLGVILDQHLLWEQHLKMLKQKLSRANGLLSKIRYFTSPNLLRTIYFAIFESHIRYGCQIWGQQKNQLLTDILELQNKALRIMNFKNKYNPYKPLYKETKVLSFADIVRLENCSMVIKQINQTLPKSLMSFIKFSENQHTYHTRNAAQQHLSVPQVNTTNYGLNSVTYKAAKDWNSIQAKIDFNFNDNYLSVLKFIKAYKNSIFNDF